MSKQDDFEYFNGYAFRTVQLVFCVDTTGSMRRFIEQTIKTVEQILNGFDYLKFFRYEFGFVAYRDHCDTDSSYLTKRKDFCSGEQMLGFVQGLDADGGGDNPEAVMVGLNECVDRLTWKDKSVKVVFHVADSPPHGKQYTSDRDEYPGGCPKGLKIEDIAKKFRKKNIKYALLDCSDKKNKLKDMKYIFENHFGKINSYSLKNGMTILSRVSEYLKEQYDKDEELIEKNLMIDMLKD